MNLSFVREPEAYSQEWAEQRDIMRKEAAIDGIMTLFNFTYAEAVDFINTPVDDEFGIDALLTFFDERRR